MAGTKMRLQRYGNEVTYRNEQEIIVDQAFLDNNNGLFITLTHPYIMGSSMLDVFYNGQRLSEGGGYEEIDAATIKLDLGVYPPEHPLAGRQIPFSLGDEIYIATWKAEYLQSGGNIDALRFLTLEEEVIKARQYTNSVPSFPKLDDRLDYIQERAETKTIVMALPRVLVGTSKYEIRFPYNGVISEVYASCSEAGAEKTVLHIEKCSQSDYDTSPSWVNILSQDITIDAHEKSSNTSSMPYVISDSRINKNDHFRVNVTEKGNGIAGLTVEVVVNI